MNLAPPIFADSIGVGWHFLIGGTGFITRWTVAGDAAARTITLPLTNGGGSVFNCTVDWGDGTPFSTVTAYNDANRIHTYAGDGTYNVEIQGTCEGWSFNNAGDKLKLTAIVNWGSISTFAGFKYLLGGFYGCANNVSLPTGKILASGAGPTSFGDCFRANAFTTIPAGMFDYCTGVLSFNACFSNNAALTTIPAGLFDHCTAATTFYFTFSTDGLLTAIPAGLFDHCILVTNFSTCFYGTALTTIPAGLFDYCTLATNFSYCFYGNTPLQVGTRDFLPVGGEPTRFLNKMMNFSYCYARSSFAGVQGTAPDLWNCDFGETITLDVAPAVDWAPGDTITGQTSLATTEVVSRTSALVYKIKKHFGTFVLGEVVGVTGVPSKLADQGAANPIFVGTPVSAACFGGAGNDLTSISNYAAIPASWTI
jgi:hypothetical protein